MASTMQFMPSNKNVLQQTNNNVPVLVELKSERKSSEKEQSPPKRNRKGSQETENREATPKSVASKLRQVRLEASSQKMNVHYPLRVSRYPGSSDETGEEDEERERVRKPRPIIPNYVTKTDKGQYRKRRKSRTDAADLSSQREKPQASVSIAKRNARERNRVKLVNQGFATLRSRIPDYISEIYTEEKKKKKVSKVETLRMALGYIRHLTEMLELRTNDPNEWFRLKSDEIWKNASNSSTGYPSPDTEYQQSPGGLFGARDGAFYDYDIELEDVRRVSEKEEEEGEGEEEEEEDEEEENGENGEDGEEEEEGEGEDCAREEKDEGLLINESAFSVDVGCCYDIDKSEIDMGEPKKTPTLPSITESFPKKSLRGFYKTPSFLSGSSAFNV